MATRIKITAGEVTVYGELNETPTALLLAEVLPVTAQASRWGKEIYFPIPVEAGEEPDARQVVQAGEIGYWPQGSSMCLFFGPTPASRGDEVRAASPVNVIGTIEGDLSVLDNVAQGAQLTVERA